MRKIGAYLAGVVLLIILWIFLSLSFSTAIIPFPWEVIRKMLTLLAGPAIYYHLAMTLVRSLLGFLLALLAGTLLGIIAGRSLFLPVMLMQAAPPLLWIIPLMLILGTDGASPAAVVFFIALPLVIINIQEGMKTIGKDMTDLFRIYAPSKRMRLTRLYIPALAGYFKSILVLGSALALKSSLVGEWFGARNGIGRLINEYFYTFDMPLFYATSLLYICLTLIITVLVKQGAERAFCRKASVLHQAPQPGGNTLQAKHPRQGVLQIQNLDFAYGKKSILRDITLRLEENSSVILTGDSGTGKTTLAKLATGLLHPSNGVLHIPSRPCLVFQDDLFCNQLDCFGNAALPAAWEKRRAYETEVLSILGICGLGGCEHLFPDELSGGMKKRLAFARALVLAPDLIVLDEPFNKLHREARSELWELFHSLFIARGIPSLIITHYPEEVAAWGLPVLELRDGRLCGQG